MVIKKLKVPTLESERLILRKFVNKDIQDLIKIEKVDRKIGKINSVEKAKIWIKKSISKDGFYFGILLKRENKIIGYVELDHLDYFGPKTGEIGYHINKKYFNKGYATEASKIVINYCFKKLKFHKVYADTSPKNLASQKVLKKLSFKFEGRIRERHFSKRKWVDEMSYGLLKRDLRL